MKLQKLEARRLFAVAVTETFPGYYELQGDNAANVSGYSVRPGIAASRFGFKLKWDAMHNGDTFIDAVWAYRFP